MSNLLENEVNVWIFDILNFFCLLGFITIVGIYTRICLQYEFSMSFTSELKYDLILLGILICEERELYRPIISVSSLSILFPGNCIGINQKLDFIILIHSETVRVIGRDHWKKSPQRRKQFKKIEVEWLKQILAERRMNEWPVHFATCSVFYNETLGTWDTPMDKTASQKKLFEKDKPITGFAANTANRAP